MPPIPRLPPSSTLSKDLGSTPNGVNTAIYLDLPTLITRTVFRQIFKVLSRVRAVLFYTVLREPATAMPITGSKRIYQHLSPAGWAATTFRNPNTSTGKWDGLRASHSAFQQRSILARVGKRYNTSLQK